MPRCLELQCGTQRKLARLWGIHRIEAGIAFRIQPFVFGDIAEVEHTGEYVHTGSPDLFQDGFGHIVREDTSRKARKSPFSIITDTSDE